MEAIIISGFFNGGGKGGNPGKCSLLPNQIVQSSLLSNDPYMSCHKQKSLQVYISSFRVSMKTCQKSDADNL